jgi:hypothetical protein
MMEEEKINPYNSIEINSDDIEEEKINPNNYIEMQLWTSSPIRCGCIVLSRRK